MTAADRNGASLCDRLRNSGEANAFILRRQAADRIDLYESVIADLTERLDGLAIACEHVVCDSPGTPNSVKSFLRDALDKVGRGQNGYV